MPEKLCTKCGKPGEFSKNKNRSDGLCAWCKSCAKAWYDQNGEVLRAKGRERRAIDPEGARAKDRKKYDADPTSANARSKKWRDANPEMVRLQSQSERAKLSRAAWRRNNLLKANGLSAAWAKAHPEKRTTANQKRRAALLGAENTLTEAQWLEILEYFNYSCAYCRRNDVPMTMDHIFAVSKGGGTTAENVVPACGCCNPKKGNRGILSMVNVGGSDASMAA